MIPSLRRKFNEDFRPEKYQHLLDLLTKRSGVPPRFRVNETPCFFSSDLIRRTARYGREMVEQLLSNEQYMRESDRSIPEAYRVPNEDRVPLFVQADFGLDSAGEPKLVEIQGFPSLYAYQPLLSGCYRDAYCLDPTLNALPGGATQDEYNALFRKAVVAECDPETVVLMEVDPLNQKTRADFVMTEKICGIHTIDIREIHKQGRKLFYERDARMVPIERIYNRTIVDELERRNIEFGFDFRDDLDVQWAGHPNWFFRLSKFSMPYLDHPAVPRTRFLADAGNLGDPGKLVLKPLYSFAGLGVIVGPTHEDIQAARGHDYIVQERVDFASVIETPYGPDKAEIRIMYIWLDELHAVNAIVRTGRGSQMGVDHNKGLEWVGASAAFLS